DTSCPGIARRKTRVNALMTRASIFFARSSYEDRWIAGSSPAMTTVTCVSKRHDDAVERRVAIDQVHPLRRDQDGAVGLHQAVEGGAGEQPLAVATVFDHEELRAHGAGIVAAVLDRHVADDAAGARARLLRI